MKKAITAAAVIAVSLVIASPCFTQVKENTMQAEKAADLKSDMSVLMNDISGMTAKLAVMIKDVNPENRKKISGVMSNLAKEMTNIAGMVGGGTMTDRQLEKMSVRLMKIQRILTEMEMKK